MKIDSKISKFFDTEKPSADREIAIKWWTSLSVDSKVAWTEAYYEDRTHGSLTGREIEVMFNSDQPTTKLSAEEWLSRYGITWHTTLSKCYTKDRLKGLYQLIEGYATHKNQQP